MNHKEIKKINNKEYNLRKKSAECYNHFKICDDYNPDVVKIPHYIGAFTKSLYHDRYGRVNSKDYRVLLHGLAGDLAAINDVKYAGERTLVNPSCIYSLDLIGPYKSTTCIPRNPLFQSAETAGEMVELYAMALMRDVHFNEYYKHPRIIHYINQCSDFKGPKNKKGYVTPHTLFRGNSCGDLKGPYVSQFLYLPFSQGALNCEQKYDCYEAHKDFMTKWDDALLVQNGNVKGKLFRPIKRYILTLRDGATYVHLDAPFTSGYNAANILYALNCPPPKGSPFVRGIKQEPFVDMGPGDIYDMLGRASRVALMTAWFHKWNLLRVRPEAYGMEVEKAKYYGNKYHINDDLMCSPILKLVKKVYGSYLLPQAYPEGSPCHPSYPAGHATFIGALVTILKAYYDEDYEFDAYGPCEDGSELVKLGYKLRVGDELDKLASNIAIFRNGAGVHYRSDALGIEVGEDLAIEILQEHVQRYCYKTYFVIHKRNGKKVVIKN